MYYLSKIIKKLYPAAIKNSTVDKSAKVEGGTQFISSSLGRYSFCGYNCTIVNTTIGDFCSLASEVKIGLAKHPLEWVSTSPAFYYGRDSIKKDLANKACDLSVERTIIGDDVWIGENVFIKSGVTVGTGAVVGMGSIVTKDIPPYEIWAGNPAHLIRKRFDDDTIQLLLESKWWKLTRKELKQLSNSIDNPQKFIELVSKIKE